VSGSQTVAPSQLALYHMGIAFCIHMMDHGAVQVRTHGFVSRALYTASYVNMYALCNVHAVARTVAQFNYCNQTLVAVTAKACE
jgi:hypothetical protein